MRYAGQVFDSFFVLESLCKSELQTGTELHSNYLSPHGRRARVVVVDPVQVTFRAELKSALRSVRRMVAKQRLSPVIQIETHGNTHGLLLASGEHMEWRELGLLLQQINEASENTLFIGSSMCFGAWMFRAITRIGFLGRAPLWGFVGPTDKAMPNNLLEGFGELYRCLLYDQDTQAAFTALAQGAGDVSVVLSEVVWGRWWQHMLRLENKYAERRYTKLMQHLGLCVDDSETRQGRLTENAIRRLFSRHRQRYLYLDLFPHHDHRFGITFDMLRTADLGFGDPRE